MNPTASIDLVNQFWSTVWNPPYDLEAVDALVAEDFVITSAGKDIRSRDTFKDWIVGFQSKITELQLFPLETFANPDGSRVVSRWKIDGKNNGIMGTAADGQPIELTGIAIWEVANGKLTHNWVERSAFELHQTLTQAKR